jgi:hypothetical protein
MNIKPATKFVAGNTPWRQYLHLLSEVFELFKALLMLKCICIAERCNIFSLGNKKDAIIRVGEEIADVQISGETLRVCCGIKDRKWSEIRLGVMRNNIERGYYSAEKEELK